MHELLCNLNSTTSDISNLKTSLQIIEHSHESAENELRAALNMTILCLSSLEAVLSTYADSLDGVLLETWHTDSTSLPKQPIRESS